MPADIRAFLAEFKHAGETAEIMGHKSPRMLYKHYRDLIKNDEDVDLDGSYGAFSSLREPQRLGHFSQNRSITAAF